MRHRKLTLGYVALHVQRWTHMGIHLGEVVHSLALAPGESRNVAFVDWKRGLLARRGESTDALEWLQSQIVQSRALDAVAAGTAQDHQWGQTTALSANVLTGMATVGGAAFAAGVAGSVAGTAAGAVAGGVGGAALGSLLGPLTVPLALTGMGAGSMVGSVAGGVGAASIVGIGMSIGHIRSESSGERGAAAEERQNIMDVTAQKASVARSLRSTIVVEDQQSGSAAARTLNVTNYNHAHALNLTYYEILNKYLVTIRTERVEPFLVVPFVKLNFDITTVVNHWNVLRHGFQDRRLVDRFDQLLGGTGQLPHGSAPVSEDPNAVLVRGAVVLIAPKRVSPSSPEVPADPRTVTLKDGDHRLEGDNGEDHGGTWWLRYLTTQDLSLSQIRKIIIELPSAHPPGDYAIKLKHAVVRATNPNREVTLENLDFGSFRVSRVTRVETDKRDFGFVLADRLVQSESDALDDSRLIQEVLAVVHARPYLFTRLLLAHVEGELLADALSSLEFDDGTDKVRLDNVVHPEPIGISSRGLLFRLKTIRGPLPQWASREPWSEIVSYPSNLQQWLNGVSGKYPAERDRSNSDVVFLPSSGVFAEAVLGRSNAAEKIDLTRFWNWQDSPIPNAAPSIEPPRAEGEAAATPVMAPTVPSNHIQVVGPGAFPAPTGMSGILSTLQNGAMFRDMSKSEQLIGLSTSLANAAQAIATSAGEQAGEAATGAMQSAAKMGETAANLAAKTAESLEKSEASEPESRPPGETVTERGGNEVLKHQPSPPPKPTTPKPKESKPPVVQPAQIAKPDETIITFRVEDCWGREVDANIHCAVLDAEVDPSGLLYTEIRRNAPPMSSMNGMLPPLRGLTQGVLDLNIEIVSDFYSGVPAGWVRLGGSTGYNFPPGKRRFARFEARQGYEEQSVTVNEGETLLDRSATTLAGKVNGNLALKWVLKMALHYLDASSEPSAGISGELSGSHTWEEAVTTQHSTARTYKIRIPSAELRVRQVLPQIGP